MEDGNRFKNSLWRSDGKDGSCPNCDEIERRKIERLKSENAALRERLDRIAELLTDAQLSDDLSDLVEKLDAILSIAKGDK